MTRSVERSVEGGEPESQATTLDVLDGSYDVVVVGGGINGAAIARALAGAGYSVLVLEKEDYGWGTTWRSTKLIHGGLRYLEHGEFGLVFESLRDQRALLAEYPEMVRPLSFLLPIYRGSRHRAATIGLGLHLYDALSYGRSLPRHRRLTAASAAAVEPGIARSGLDAAFTYSDCQVPYPERLCLQTLLEARDAGAAALNHAEVTGFLRAGDRISGVTARIARDGDHRPIRSRLVINAAGPWVDEVLSAAGAENARYLGGTRGAHIVVDFGDSGPRHALYAEARSDHRPFFIIPWRGKHLIGTTDTRFDGSPDAVAANAHDIDYLFGEAKLLLPGIAFERSQILYAYAGVRPLPATSGVAEGAITRRHIVHDHAADGHAGLWSIIGGKLSTYRSLAAQVLNQVVHQIGAPPRRGGRPAASCRAGGCCRRQEAGEQVVRSLRPALLDHLRAVYGPRTGCVLAVLAEAPALVQPLCEHGPEIEAQVVLAARHEQARTLSDVLMRRTGAAWNRCLGFDCAPRCAALMAAELGWPAERTADEMARYRADVRRTFVMPDSISGLPVHND